MAPTNPCCTIGTKIETKAVHVTSLAEGSRRYGANKKTRILVGTVLAVEMGRRQIHWVGAGILLSQYSTLAEDP